MIQPVAFVAKFETTSDDLQRALEMGFRLFDFSGVVNVPWKAPICLDGMEAQTLVFMGTNQLMCNVQREFEGDLPCLYADKSEWRFHCAGVNWLGNAGSDDRHVPLVRFKYLDRSSFRDMGVYAGRIELGKDGYCSQVVFDHIEGHRSPMAAWDLFGIRKLTFQGRCSIERNGLDNPALYPGLSIQGDPTTADRGQSIVTGIAFEHDDDQHDGLSILSCGDMVVGNNRHMRAGMYASCYASTWLPNTMYGTNTRMERKQLAGGPNRWPGRFVRLNGPVWNRQLEWEPESSFDLRIP